MSRSIDSLHHPTNSIYYSLYGPTSNGKFVFPIERPLQKRKKKKKKERKKVGILKQGRVEDLLAFDDSISPCTLVLDADDVIPLKENNDPKPSQ